MSDLKTIKNFFKQKEQAQQSSSGNKFYNFWLMKDDESALVRFIPDADQDNPMGFMVENVTHNLYINGKRKVVPCMKHMYGEDCPICNHSAKLYDQGNQDEGKKFYRKKEYLGNVIVVDSPFDYQENDESKSVQRYISFGPQILKIIQNAFMSDDLDAMPCDYDEGYDFRIQKSKQGEYSTYSLSNFARKSSAVPIELREMIQEVSLKSLRTPPMAQDVMEALLLSAITGNDNAPSEERAVREAATASANNVAGNDDAPVTASPTGDAPRKSAAELIAEIKAKKAAQGQ